MKSINWIQLFFGLAIFGMVACTSNASTEDQTEDEPTEEPEEQPAPQEDASTIKGENFEIAVIESGIPSPRKEMKGTIGETEITVNYGSPSVKGRTIWGDLVPYDKVWRTGANKCTSITLSSDANINGQTLAAGTYGLFTIPGESEWVVIFNENSSMWGSGDYSEDKDALRVSVSPQNLEETQEAMEFMVDGENLVLKWDKVAVPVALGPA